MMSEIKLRTCNDQMLAVSFLIINSAFRIFQLYSSKWGLRPPTLALYVNM